MWTTAMGVSNVEPPSEFPDEPSGEQDAQGHRDRIDPAFRFSASAELERLAGKTLGSTPASGNGLSDLDLRSPYPRLSSDIFLAPTSSHAPLSGLGADGSCTRRASFRWVRRARKGIRGYFHLLPAPMRNTPS